MDAFAEWLWPDESGHYIGEAVSPKWRRARISHAKHIIDVLGETPARDLAFPHVHMVQQYCVARGMPNETANAITHSVLLGMVRDVEGIGMIPVGTHARLLGIKKMRHDKRRRWAAFTIEQRDAAIDYFAPLPSGPLVAFLLLTGCRIGEAEGLKQGDFDWSRGQVTIERSREGDEVSPCKEEASQRAIYMPDDLVAALQPLRRFDFPYFFLSAKRDRPMSRQSFRNNEWLPGLERASLPVIRIHDCRHTWATIALQHGGQSLAEVAAHLGHNMRETIATYSHVLPPKDVNRAIGRPDPPPTAVHVVTERRLHLVK